MLIDITCFTCYESFSEYMDVYDGLHQEVIDCEICCRPNKIVLEQKNGQIIRIDISDGNE
jgi:hypothetical protein